MERAKLAFVPEWKGPVEGWAVNYIEKNLWRVLPDHDFDDLYQDAYFYFLECCWRYPKVCEAAHFMALFKRCLTIQFHDYASARTTRSQVTLMSEESENDLSQVAELRPSDELEIDLKLDLEAAPPNVRQLILAAMENAGKRAFRRRGAVRETTNQFLCRLAGVTSAKLRKEFEEWLSGNTRLANAIQER